MTCPRCGSANAEERRFCSGCGAALSIACPSCGASNRSSDRFCGGCGKALETPEAAPTAAPTSGAPLPDAIAAGRYKIARLLGEGRSKVVYLAHDTLIDRDVAIALFKTEELDEAGRERVRREARAMGRLGEHPHIVNIYDVGNEDGRPYIVSQYMSGGSVDDRLRQSGRRGLGVDEAVRIGAEVADALDFAHARGVIHRDLKPANVFLAASRECKLGDFGLAIAPDQSRLTVQGMMVGTVAYMPPEQALGRPLVPQSDLYSLGAMLYEMLSGRPPFVGDDLLTVVSQHVNAAAPPPSSLAPEVPAALDELVLKLLAKTPEQRPASAARVRDLLRTSGGAARTAMDVLASTLMVERPNLSAHAAPDGTVTILFTDVENSTVITERLGDLRARAVLAAHNRLIREQVAANQGYEVKSMGDGFMIAFSSARRALQCAIGIQRALAATPPSAAEIPIRVRIGINTGEAIREEGGDFFGKAVILAARIGAAAQAEEILVSPTVKEVAQSAGDVRFDQGREIALKGLSGTYRVYRVIWDERERICPKCSRPIPRDAAECPHCTAGAVAAMSHSTGAYPPAPPTASRAQRRAARREARRGEGGIARLLGGRRWPLILLAVLAWITAMRAMRYLFPEHREAKEEAAERAQPIVAAQPPAAVDTAAAQAPPATAVAPQAEATVHERPRAAARRRARESAAAPRGPALVATAPLSVPAAAQPPREMTASLGAEPGAGGMTSAPGQSGPAQFKPIARLNFFRNQMGLPPVRGDFAGHDANTNQALSLIQNALAQASAGGRGGGFANRPRSWIIADSPDEVAAAESAPIRLMVFNPPAPMNGAKFLNHMMFMPFTSLRLLDPQLREASFGGGCLSGNCAAVLSVTRGLARPVRLRLYEPTGGGGDEAGGSPTPVEAHLKEPFQFPAPEQTTMILAYHGGDWPNPLAACPGYTTPTGPAIIIQLGAEPGAPPSVSSHTFERAGLRLEHCAIDANAFAAVGGPAGVAGSRLLREMGAVMLIPREQLAPGATYNVSIAAGGKNYSWSFLTGAPQ
jgi:class 3 adenylate cyclase/tRNA A-37 threonylcarbamoyl transferase component Bud32